MGSFKRKDTFQCFLNTATKSANYPVVLKAKPALWLPNGEYISKPKMESGEISYIRKHIFRAFFPDIYVATLLLRLCW